MRLRESLDGRLALAGGREGDPGAELDQGPLERDLEVLVQLGRPRELLRGGVGLIVRQRRLAERVREGGEGVGVARGGGDARQRLGARARLGEVVVAGEEAGRPAQAPDGVVVVLAALPALEQEAAVVAGGIEVAVVLGQPARVPRRCPRSSTSR